MCLFNWVVLICILYNKNYYHKYSAFLNSSSGSSKVMHLTGVQNLPVFSDIGSELQVTREHPSLWLVSAARRSRGRCTLSREVCADFRWVVSEQQCSSEVDPSPAELSDQTPALADVVTAAHGGSCLQCLGSWPHKLQDREGV